MLRKEEVRVLYVIILLIALPQFSEAMYAVSLPKIAASFQVTTSLVEYTLVSYFIGFAIGILLWGNLSDKIGRKTGLILGLLCYVFATILCCTSYSISYLIIMRFIQGMGTSVGSVMGQALVRDMIKQEDRQYVFAIINIAMAFVPAVGLIISNIIIETLQWRITFILLIVIGIIILVNSLLFIPNTHITQQQTKHLFKKCITQIIKDYKGIRLGFFIGGSLGILFGYFVESSFYFIDILKVSPLHYGIISLFISVPLFIGGVISKKINYTSDIKIHIGIRIIFVFSILFYFLTISNCISLQPANLLTSLTLSLICIYSILAAVSMIIPNCLSQVLENYGKYIGTAASIFGFYYYITTALFITLMNLTHSLDLKGLPMFLMVSSILMFIIAVLCKKERSLC